MIYYSNKICYSVLIIKEKNVIPKKKKMLAITEMNDEIILNISVSSRGGNSCYRVVFGSTQL